MQNLANMHICTKLHGNTANICLDISVWANQTELYIQRARPRAKSVPKLKEILQLQTCITLSFTATKTNQELVKVSQKAFVGQSQLKMYSCWCTLCC